MSDRITLELYIVRHGETWGNLSEEERVKNGRQSDPESMLTPKGINQAVLLGERLSAGEFDAAFASPLTRAIGTAYEITSRQKNKSMPIEILPDLFEMDTEPGYLGYPCDKIIEMFPTAVPCICEPTPTGGRLSLEKENVDIVLERARRCIKYFKHRFKNGEKVLVAAHGSFNTFLIRAALGLDNVCDFTFSQENTGLTKIKYIYEDESNMERVKLSYSNDTSHLFSHSPDLAFTL